MLVDAFCDKLYDKVKQAAKLCFRLIPRGKMMSEKELLIKDLGEFSLIEHLVEVLGDAARGTGQGVIRGIGDDAAVLQVTSGQRLLVSCDMFIEGIHFNWHYCSPHQLGWKALVANLSDIAAMGGRPRWALVSLGLPPETPLKRVEGIYRGIAQLCKEFGVTIVGGDTTSSPRGTVLDITVLGESSRSKIAYRSGASEGDWLLVTGELGKAAAGLACLQEGIECDASVKDVIQAHLMPWPRVREAAVLMSSNLVGALNDISDGLVSEAAEIALASGLGVVLWEERIPVSSSAKKWPGAWTATPYIGPFMVGKISSYLTIPGGKGAPMRIRRLVRSLKKTTGTSLTIIGRMVPPEGVRLIKKMAL